MTELTLDMTKMIKLLVSNAKEESQVWVSESQRQASTLRHNYNMLQMVSIRTHVHTHHTHTHTHTHNAPPVLFSRLTISRVVVANQI